MSLHESCSIQGGKNVNIESKSSLSQMRRKSKRVPKRACEDEKKSMKYTKRQEVRVEDRKEGRPRQVERVMKRQTENAAG